ncbi:sulfurtransferase TusA family protein [Exiguobacterium sp. SL14]|nr:sulfurtransferase TusA family protein [Exiguobacterium sp. SL14]MCY1692378.1 sulfurtransferase TusA family protein [Exiguobacterium sp. SL14]
MTMIKSDIVLDAKGLACPMPIVRTKKTIKTLEPGQVIEVQATDKGSTADLRAWANSTGNHYLGTIEEGEVLRHYVRKSTGDVTEPVAFNQTVDNAKVEATRQDDSITVLDVREQAEYAFAHVPGAINIPLGELEARHTELDSNQTIYVICRTGSRSDMACRQLSDKGYTVHNVVPGMQEWAFETTTLVSAK